MKNTLILLLNLLVLISCKSIENTPQKVFYKNYYAFDFEIENDLKKDSINPDYQFAATKYALKGDHKNALRIWDLVFKPTIYDLTDQQKDSIKKEKDLIEAKDFILKKSEEERIIMLTESHYMIPHRVFAKSLLQGLYDNGYRLFCVETLGNGKYEDTLLNSRKYPIQDSGYYSINPQFGELIREALKIGFTVLPYETTQEIGDEIREADQANNIKKIMDTYPNEKLFIYCGPGHAMEGELPYWGGKSLAGRITDITGIDPFTINQFSYSEKSKLEYRDPLPRILAPKEPSILVDPDKIPIPYKNEKSWTDILVLHPETNYINDRPYWDPKTRENFIKIDLTPFKIKHPVMIMAFHASEEWIDGVPVDIHEVNNESHGYLTLDKGIYNIIITNAEGESYKLIKKIN